MKIPDMKDWTKDQMVREIIRLHQSEEILEKEVKRMDKCIGSREETISELTKENDELRNRIEKLESDICGGSPCIVSEFHSFDGESWIRSTTYDEVLLRLKNANERISDLEQKRLNQGLDSLKGIEAIQKLNGELKAENTALKQRINALEDIGNNYEPQFAPDDDISAFNYECLKRWTTEMNCKRRIQELQDQHQQDCIRYNDMRTTYLVTLDELARLREQFGIGR